MILYANVGRKDGGSFSECNSVCKSREVKFEIKFCSFSKNRIKICDFPQHYIRLNQIILRHPVHIIDNI